jgi:hypothetical protein
MSVQQPYRFRKAVMAGVVALALSGAVAAVVWAEADPSPSPSQSAPSQSAPSPSPSQSQSAPSPSPSNGSAKGKGHSHAVQLHGEKVVKKSDGTFETRVTQQGTVEAVSGSSIKVKSEDGFSQDYAINADTKIVKVPAPAADGTPAKDDAGKRLKPAAASAADIKQGDSVRLEGVKDGSGVTARNIVDGVVAGGKGNGLGLGRGHGLGHGHGHGLGHGKDRAPKPSATPAP